MKYIMDTEILADIGLTNSEIKVYIALLELGASTAGPILDKTGLHNSVVHMTLNKLIEKGLVSFSKEGKRKQYQPANPKHIIEYIEQKKENFQKILPELLAKQGLSKEKPEVTTFRGKKGIREILFELLDAGGKEHHTIGSPKESIMLGDAFWIDYHKQRAKRKIQAKLLLNESLRAWSKKSGYYSFADLKYYEKGFEPLSETIIRNDKVGILIWTEKPIGILIQNKEAADSYEKYFQFLWKKAKS